MPLDPIPLTSPDGTVRAYACPRCFRVNMSVHCGGPTGRQRETEYSKERAAQCGICRKCGAEFECGHDYQCPACRTQERQESQARYEAEAPERERCARIYQESLSKAKDPHIAESLRDFMSDLSEDYYCAGWLTGLEFSLWSMLQGRSRAFGLGTITESEIHRLRYLSEACGGWWIWDDAIQGNRFVTLDEFKPMFEPYNHKLNQATESSSSEPGSQS